MFKFLLLGTALCSSFTLNIKPYTKECFFEDLKKDDRLEVSFEVIQTIGDWAVDYEIKTPGGATIHKVQSERASSFGFDAASNGEHHQCFDNKSGYDKIVQFSFLGPDDQSKIEIGKDLSEDEKELGKNIQDLSNQMRFMKDELDFLNRRIKRHKATAESTYSRVFWWTFFQLMILLGVVGFQVTYLRQFFEKKRII
ncbi:p24 complex component [Terramyces sp. JEL0728]|nr:p24 complex component [Terramyces sp. JEL0728]